MLVGAKDVSLRPVVAVAGPSENFSALAPTLCGPCPAPNQIASPYIASSVARSLPVFLPTSAGITSPPHFVWCNGLPGPYASGNCDSLFNETLSRARHSKSGHMDHGCARPETP